MYNSITIIMKRKGKAIPVKGREGPWGFETSRLLPHFLDNRLTDGGEVVSLTRLTKIIFNIIIQ
jgi:hypothetical protein